MVADQLGNITRAADALGLERSYLYRKMRFFWIRSLRQTEAVEEPVSGPVDTPARDPS